MYTIDPVYVVAAIAAASGTGCDAVESFERETQVRRGRALTDAEAARLLAGAGVLRASLCPETLADTAPPQAA